MSGALAPAIRPAARPASVAVASSLARSATAPPAAPENLPHVAIIPPTPERRVSEEVQEKEAGAGAGGSAVQDAVAVPEILQAGRRVEPPWSQEGGEGAKYDVPGW
jgi:hypothetical protein